MNRDIKNTKKGFLSVEASIFVPLFVIAVLTFGYLMKVSIASENVMHIMADEARRLSMYSYTMEAMPGFRYTLTERILDENKDIDSTYVETFKYRFEHSGKEDLIGLRVSSEIKIKLPIVFKEKVEVSDVLLFRAFTGREYIPEYIDYDKMEEEEEPRIVWVFPRAGERYHEEFCRYINVAARQGLLTAEITRKYSPCSLCGAGSVSTGSVVYYFTSSGSAYHKGSCYIVDRYVISMDEKDAVSKGYTPCSVCI